MENQPKNQNQNKYELEIIKPDDWHVHLRDGESLKAIAPWTALHFQRAIVMPNLKQPITSFERALEYKNRILEATANHPKFEPLMTFYLTDQPDLKSLERGLVSGLFKAAKLYPAHATTNSSHGVTDINAIHHALDLLSKYNTPLLIHAETSDPKCDIFDREARFLNDSMPLILENHPYLKIVIEHITTQEAVKWIRKYRSIHQIAATITAHHLLINRNAMFERGLRPHNYCLPVAKREHHRLALIEAATSGESSFFIGTDSAPHPISAKESDCGCAGIFSSPTAISCYTEVFEQAKSLDNLEKFLSLNGPQFYGMPINNEKIKLIKKDALFAMQSIQLNHQLNPLSSDKDKVKIFRGNEILSWQVATSQN